MASSRTHPHTDMPTDDVLQRIIAETQPAHRELYLAMHRLVVDAVPDVRFSLDHVDAAIGYGAHQFGYNGWGMGAVMPHKGWVSLVLFRGGALDDPDGLLEGTGALVRHAKIRSLEQMESRRESLSRMIATAAGSGV